jgi:prepilin-type N-terminal cleavage/methylation domain-containing protein
MNRRRGFTLIEMLAVITVMTALMGLAVTLLILLMTADRTSRRQLIENEQIEQLAASLRRDVRAAVTAEVTDTPQALQSRLVLNTGAEQSVEYVISAGRITRTQSAGGKSAGREAYLFDDLVEAQFQIETGQGRQFAALQLTRGKPEAAPQQAVAWPPLRIIAAVAADHRLGDPERQEATNEKE